MNDNVENLEVLVSFDSRLMRLEHDEFCAALFAALYVVVESTIAFCLALAMGFVIASMYKKGSK